MNIMHFVEFRDTDTKTVAVFRFGPEIADNQEMAFNRENLEFRADTMESNGRDASLERQVLSLWQKRS